LSALILVKAKFPISLQVCATKILARTRHLYPATVLRPHLASTGENLKLNAKTWETDFDFDAAFGGNPPQEPPSTTSETIGNGIVTGTVVATLTTPRPPKANGNGHLGERDLNADGTATSGVKEGEQASNITEAERLRLQLDQAKAKSKLISSAFD
jgi:hypothetical protein